MNCSSEISAFANIYAQLASIMEILTRSAVTEISKLVKDSSEVLLLEMCRRQTENDSLKRKLEWMETELRAVRRRESRESVACSRTVAVQAGLSLRRADEWRSERRATPTEIVFDKEGPRLRGSGDVSFPRAAGSPAISVVECIEIEDDPPETVIIKQERIEDEFEDPESQRSGLVIITAGDQEEYGAHSSPAGGSEELKESRNCKGQIIPRLSRVESQHLAVNSFSLDSAACDVYEGDAQPWTYSAQRDSETETDDPDFPYDAGQNAQGETRPQQSHVVLDALPGLEVKPHSRMLNVVPKEEEGAMLVDMDEGAKLEQSQHTGCAGRLRSARELASPPGQQLPRPPGGTVPGAKAYAGSHAKMTKKMKSLRRSPKSEKQISCVQCGKSFTTRFYLKIHQRIHTGERPFSCTQCGKSFYCTSHLISHQRSHTGEKPYRCHECGNSYSHLNSLKLHHKVHRQERLFSST